jgi:hypothetical protein
LAPSKTRGLLVRKAIAYAINLEEIRRVVLGDEYEIFYHPTSPLLNEWLSPNSFRYCYRLDYARALMTVAGYDLGCGQSSEPFEFLDWEDLCGTNPSSVSGTGFNSLMVLIVVTFMSSSITILGFRKRRK